MTSSAKGSRWHRAPRSLRVQMALGSALVAFGAVVFVLLTSLVAVAFSFNHFQRTQLASEANQLAVAFGGGNSALLGLHSPGSSVTAVPTAPGPLAKGTRFAAAYLWVMDTSGQLLVSPGLGRYDKAVFARDSAIITPALHQALLDHTSEDTLTAAPLSMLADRLYVAVPIHNGGSSGAIVGALALSTPPTSERVGALAFLSESRTLELVAALVVAALAGLAALVFSRRLTQPLAGLRTATLRMAAGDYGARVAIRAPLEVHDLAESFNGMAAALERDVTELRRQEQLRRELVANVSHELATPLTAIEGFSEALLDGVVHDPVARERTVRTIQREAARLHRLVDQLRQIARLDAGVQALERGSLAIGPLVMETLAVLAPELEQQAVTVSTELPAELPLVNADADRVAEILLNLLDNALHHTPPGGHIEVSVTRTGQEVRLSIADSGPGVPAELRERIFERFFRADPSRAAATGGTGLGLAIVRALVEAHGGAISVGERAGGGALFSFTLPVAEQNITTEHAEHTEKE